MAHPFRLSVRCKSGGWAVLGACWSRCGCDRGGGLPRQISVSEDVERRALRLIAEDRFIAGASLRVDASMRGGGQDMPARDETQASHAPATSRLHFEAGIGVPTTRRYLVPDRIV